VTLATDAMADRDPDAHRTGTTAEIIELFQKTRA
jgi:hypothetical protein